MAYLSIEQQFIAFLSDVPFTHNLFQLFSYPFELSVFTSLLAC